MESSFFRCSHCRGFYPAASGEHCRYCDKSVPLKDAAGNPKVFQDRATCRAIQIAEFEQLPPEAHKDCFRPDPEVLYKLCHCIHCGEGRGLFEAVEMRWMVNEQMWACPCTTCGGRGFTFDIHLAERLWQCFDCQHWYKPANNDYRGSNAKCPRCGCRNASGWFDDEELTPEEEAWIMRDYEERKAQIEEEERLGLRPKEEEWKPEPIEDPPGSMVSRPEDEPMQDDIDFPRERRKGDAGDLPGEDEIPW